MEKKMSKERSNNFSREELNKLKELIEKYPIILNKKTDHASSKQKDEAWRQLTNEFNSNNLVYRAKQQLIYKFNNMKKVARKELSHERKERRCTGGGPPPPKPSDTSEWLCSIMGESIVGLPSTHDSDFIPDNTENSDVPQQNVTLPNIEMDIFTQELPFHIEEYHDNILSNDLADHNVSIIDVKENQETVMFDTTTQKTMLTKPVFKPLENQETVKFDTSTPKSMLKKPVSKPLEPDNRKRKLIYTPVETRKQIVTMVKEKEFYIKKKGTRDLQLLEFAREEHQKNMQHKEEMHRIEVEFKKKLNELMLKKAALEIDIEEEKLKKLKSENKDLLDYYICFIHWFHSTT